MQLVAAPFFSFHMDKKETGVSGWRWVPSLYVFQGLPSCLVMTTSAMMYKDMGVGVASFAFWTSLVCLPWSLKPLWAPVVERYRTKRAWVLACQVLLVALLVGLGLSFLTGAAFYALSLCLMLLVAMASASHDIACDGYYMMALSERGQSFFVGIRSTFYRVAMVAATGLVPFVAGRVGASAGDAAVGWSTALCGAGAALLVLFALCRWGMPVVAERRGRQDDGLRILARALRSFFSHPGAAATVTFFAVYRLGEALLAKIVTPFLIDSRSAGGIGLSVDQCGIVYGTFGVLALVLGGILGGVQSSRLGLRRTLWPMVALMNLPNLAYVALAHWQPAASSGMVTAAVVTEQFGYGFGFTAYMLVMLRYVGKAEYKAAEYAIGTSIMSLSLILPGMTAGWVMEILGGYEALFVAACVLTFPGIVAAGRVRQLIVSECRMGSGVV